MKAFWGTADDPYTRSLKIYKSSAYSLSIKAKQDDFFENDPVGKKLPQNEIFRNVVRWGSPIRRANEPAPDITPQQMSEKASAAYVMIHGRDVDGVQKTDLERRAAFDAVKGDVEAACEEMDFYSRISRQMFQGEGSPYDLLREIDKVQEFYEKSGPVLSLIGEMVKSSVFSTLPQNDQDHILEMYGLASAYNLYFADLIQQGKQWGQYTTFPDPNNMDPELKPKPLPPLSFYINNQTRVVRDQGGDD